MAFLMETESKITETVCFLAEISKNFDKNAEQKPLFLIFRKAKVRPGPVSARGQSLFAGEALDICSECALPSGEGRWKRNVENLWRKRRTATLVSGGWFA